MSGLQVLLVAGTHGNEVNAPWLFEEWSKKPWLINTNGLSVCKVIGNPLAYKSCRRYLERDLNRSFLFGSCDAQSNKAYEFERARELLSLFGSSSDQPCQLCIDFHSTTAAMGSCLVVYGRRPADLALASLMQARLGLPVYLHEGDYSQTGFLVEAWPCGVVVEIGPVPQGILNAKIVEQTHIALEACLGEIAKARSRMSNFPKQLVIHRHLGSLDFPRDSEGKVESFIHSSLDGADWHPLCSGAPLFISSDGDVQRFYEDESVVPVFINEAAYMEKNIAMSLTKREVWPFSNKWSLALEDLIQD